MPPNPSSSTPACVCGRLRRAARALTQRYDDLMAPSGLRVTQFSLLRALAREGTTRMSDLAQTLLLDRTALSRTLDPLAERGLVAIVPGSDGRTREVSLTRSGGRALRTASVHWQRAQREVAAQLGDAKLEALIDSLSAVEQLHPDSGGRARRHV